MKCWHRWTKWEQYIQKVAAFSGAYPLVDAKGEQLVVDRIRQRRNCEKCGFQQDTIVADVGP